MHPLRARVFAFLAVLLVALPAEAFAQSQYFCNWMGSVMESCCCESEDRASQTACGIEVKPADCCKLIEQANRESVPATRDAAGQMPFPALLATLPAIPLLTEDYGRSFGGVARQARAPPALGPPLFLKNCALLS